MTFERLEHLLTHSPGRARHIGQQIDSADARMRKAPRFHAPAIVASRTIPTVLSHKLTWDEYCEDINAIRYHCETYIHIPQWALVVDLDGWDIIIKQDTCDACHATALEIRQMARLSDINRPYHGTRTELFSLMTACHAIPVVAVVPLQTALAHAAEFVQLDVQERTTDATLTAKPAAIDIVAARTAASEAQEAAVAVPARMPARFLPQPAAQRELAFVVPSQNWRRKTPLLRALPTVR